MSFFPLHSYCSFKIDSRTKALGSKNSAQNEQDLSLSLSPQGKTERERERERARRRLERGNIKPFQYVPLASSLPSLSQSPSSTVVLCTRFGRPTDALKRSGDRAYAARAAEKRYGATIALTRIKGILGAGNLHFFREAIIGTALRIIHRAMYLHRDAKLAPYLKIAFGSNIFLGEVLNLGTVDLWMHAVQVQYESKCQHVWPCAARIETERERER